MKSQPTVDLKPLESIFARHAASQESLLPVLQEAQQAYGYLPKEVLKAVSRRLKVAESRVYGVASFYSMLRLEPVGSHVIDLCEGPLCELRNKEIRETLNRELRIDLDTSLRPPQGIGVRGTDPSGKFTYETTSCLGYCAQGPLMFMDGNIYTKLSTEKVKAILSDPEGFRPDALLPKGMPPELTADAEGETRRVLADVGKIDPESMEDYREAGGLQGIDAAIAMEPEEVIRIVKESGLRGRGGAGFPTGLKWEFTAKAPGDEKYIILNADESEPGVFKDRLILQSVPYRVLEGMVIAGYAVGASKGYIYLRGEYKHLRDRLERVIEQMERCHFLGDNILGSDFSFHIELHLGAGAYICGEETALIESLEGKRGQPRQRPPYPPTYGFRGKPTVVNNVETLANVPDIIAYGPDWYKEVGTPGSPGTKVFTIVGDVNRPGAFEVPFGITPREAIERFGKGIRNGNKFHFAQVGGSAGAFIPESLLDVPLDYDSVKKGVTLGAGSILVADHTACVLDILRATMDFFRHESCGKCAPCRLGTYQSYSILTNIAFGKGKEGDLELLEHLADHMRKESFCGLGQSAAVPLQTALEHFREEIEAHLHGHCPAGVCDLGGEKVAG